MVISWREMLKFLAFVVLIGLVVFYVAANRQHLTDRFWPSSAGTPSTSVASDGASTDGASSSLADPIDGQTAEIISVSASAANSLTTIPQAGATGGSDLFVEFRLAREQARSRQLDLLREMLGSANLAEEARDQASSLWLEITRDVASEVDIENLIRAKGFADAVVVLAAGKATIMIKAISLTQDEVLRVADLAVRIAGLEFEDVTVLARGG